MKILLVGAGGYAVYYVTKILNDKKYELAGVVEPYFDTCPTKDKLIDAGIPVYKTMEEFYAVDTATLAVISTPTFLHKEQSICALKHGSYVLCEKPVAPLPADALEMLQAEKEYGKFIAIGFQLSFSDAITVLKKDVLAGVLGKPVALRTLVTPVRNRDYYKRGSGWGGRISKDGIMLLDSVVSNACAHYVNNMLFVLGKTPEESTHITKIEAECYRANDIENFDTCFIRMQDENGVPMFFAASHATDTERKCEFVYEFENATVYLGGEHGNQAYAEFKDGTKKIYGDPLANPLKKLDCCYDCIKNGTSPVSTVETALEHVKLIEKLYLDFKPESFPQELIIEKTDADGVYVRNLSEDIYKAYENSLLYSEL